MTPRARRLAADVEELSAGYAGASTVDVDVAGDGDDLEVHVTYPTVTAGLDDDGQPVVIEAPRITVRFPERYPSVAPQIEAASPIVHPNADPPPGVALDLERPWSPSRSICELVDEIGCLLQFRTIRLDEPRNPMAAAWVKANREIFPLDDADVAPTRTIDGPTFSATGESLAGFDPRSRARPEGPGWWLASDGRYYPPDLDPRRSGGS